MPRIAQVCGGPKALQRPEGHTEGKREKKKSGILGVGPGGSKPQEGRERRGVRLRKRGTSGDGGLSGKELEKKLIPEHPRRKLCIDEEGWGGGGGGGSCLLASLRPGPREGERAEKTFLGTKKTSKGGSLNKVGRLVRASGSFAAFYPHICLVVRGDRTVGPL